MGRPTVFPTGTTLYDPSKCENGYTLFMGRQIGAILINMNGKVVRQWKDFMGMPCKMIKGGHLLGSLAARDAAIASQDFADVTMVDWDGNVEWTFNKYDHVNDSDGIEWAARQHHDYQMEGNPVGYPVPDQEVSPDFQKMMILTHKDVKKPKISPHPLLDDCVIEIDREGSILWEWSVIDHFNQFGFTEEQKNAMFRDPTMRPTGQGDLFHVNCASYVGPNHWYDEGDERFNPQNIIMDSRECNIMFIVSHETGEIVWQVGPDFTKTPELRIFGTIVGPHHTHMIPKGLPGEGHIMVYDNGGWAGYGAPNQFSKTGLKVSRRDGSRVVEFDPTTLEIVWECKGEEIGATDAPFTTHYFYSPLTSDAQRLPNGNTFICEGTSGRFMEFTPDNELVWEYSYPRLGSGLIYRAYRIPYDWVPQLPEQEEVAIERIDNTEYVLPGAEKFDLEAEGVQVSVEGTRGFDKGFANCVDNK